MQGVRYSASPFMRGLNELSGAVEAFAKAESRIGDNKRTRAIVMAAERMYEIDMGNRDGTLDSWGYEIEG